MFYWYRVLRNYFLLSGKDKKKRTEAQNVAWVFGANSIVANPTHWQASRYLSYDNFVDAQAYLESIRTNK